MKYYAVFKQKEVQTPIQIAGNKILFIFFNPKRSIRIQIFIEVKRQGKNLNFIKNKVSAYESDKKNKKAINESDLY